MEDNKIKQTQEMSIENTKMCAACSEDYKIPPSIICLPDTSYARDLQAQGACALRFLIRVLNLLQKKNLIEVLCEH